MNDLLFILYSWMRFAAIVLCVILGIVSLVCAVIDWATDQETTP